MSPPFEAGQVSDKKFAAPDLSVGSKAGAVEGHTNDLAREVILSHATGNVGVVMLHTDLRFEIKVKRKLRADITGMQIMGDSSGVNTE